MRYGPGPQAVQQRFLYHPASLRLTGIETFQYDALDRLVQAARNGVATLSLSYDDLTGNGGNIKTKSDVGTYTYGQWGMGARQVTTISNGPRPGQYRYDANGNMSCRGWDQAQQTCADEFVWYSYDLPQRLSRGPAYAVFSYGADRQRVRQTAVTATGQVTTTNYAGPHFREEAEAGFIYFVSHVFAHGRVVYTQSEYVYDTGHGGLQSDFYSYYVHPDHQGSWDRLSNAGGQYGPAEWRYSFDAWGKRRQADWQADPTDTLLALDHWTKQGCTGHEHAAAEGQEVV